MAKAYDVVCGMEVDTSSPHKAEYEGKAFYFCCGGCQGAFERSPEFHLESWQEDHPDLDPTPA